MIRRKHRFSAAALGLFVAGFVLCCELTVARASTAQVLLTGEDRLYLAQQALTLALASPDAAEKYGVDCPASPLGPDQPCTVYLSDHQLPGLIPPTIRGFRFVSISVDDLKADSPRPIKYLLVGGFRPYGDGVLVSLAVCRKNGIIGSASVSSYFFRRSRDRWEGELIIWPVSDTGGGPGNVAQLAHAAERAQRDRSVYP